MPDAYNPLIRPLLTDLYQVTMAHAYWHSRRHDTPAVFELFFRRNPFGGEFTIFAGLEEVVGFLERFRFENRDIEYLRSVLPDYDPTFFRWLEGLDAKNVTMHAMAEGSVVFPRTPLLRVEAPIALGQLLETTMLNLVNYPSLVATKAARIRLAAGPSAQLVEFGLRRAQGPDGAVSGARYSIVGGFDATSNVMAGHLFDIPVRGTHAHSFVSAFRGFADLEASTVTAPDGSTVEIVEPVLRYRRELGYEHTNTGELAAFVAWAQASPRSFLCLVDTYDTLRSGVPNFLAVALALGDVGFEPLGIRLDSGDLAYLSKEARRQFREVGSRYQRPLEHLTILASNEISERVIAALNLEGHAIDAYGIGTHLVACTDDPALGGVYKLAAIDQRPSLKVSEEIGKSTMPGSKQVWRLSRSDGTPLVDLIAEADEPPPPVGQAVTCRHPHEVAKRVEVVPGQVEPLLSPVWMGERKLAHRTLFELRDTVQAELARMRPDHLRLLNPTPYKVAVSERLYRTMERLIQESRTTVLE